jgi:hypothetical protein
MDKKREKRTNHFGIQTHKNLGASRILGYIRGIS